MHHILKKLQPNFLFLLLNFKICNFVTKKTFPEIDLYLMKIQISFEFFKKELDLYLMKKQIRFVF